MPSTASAGSPSWASGAGGVHLAGRLRARLAGLLGHEPPVGTLDIALYRDDLDQKGAVPVVGPTDVRFPVDGKTIVLVDDVLYTGRTVRAALDELVDFGRPRRVWLLVLVDRGGRELPIAADFVGTRLDVADGDDVQVRLRRGRRTRGRGDGDQEGIMIGRHKHCLGLADFSREEILEVLDLAVSMKEVMQRPIKKVPTLRGKSVVNLFFEASTRTRISFEIAAKILSADALNWTASASSVTKGETLIDTVRNLEAMRPDVIVIRHLGRRRAARWSPSTCAAR